MMVFIVGFAFGFVACAVILFIRRHIDRSFLMYLKTAFGSIQKGQYHTRLYANYRGTLKQRTMGALNEMAHSVEEVIGALSQERDILQHILQSMTTGVVYITRDGRIQMVNDAAERIFLRPAEQALHRDHWAVFRHYNLGTAVDDVLLFGTPWRGEVKLRDDLTAEVRILPIPIHSRVRTAGESAHDALFICNDVSEWKRLERMRSEFVANVSHELKTPIAAIRGFAETLLDGDVEPEIASGFVKTIYDEAHRMGNLVSDLLELSKLEGPQNPVKLESIALKPVAESAVQTLRHQATSRGVRLSIEPMDDVIVWADDVKLLQVFLNLIANAIHYTPDGGEITIWWDLYIDRVKVHVEDTGLGIAKEHHSRLYERFYRVNKDRNRSSGGTGLGLAIVKHIINLHGGEVGIESEVGKGSDFWFTLSRLDQVKDEF